MVEGKAGLWRRSWQVLNSWQPDSYYSAQRGTPEMKKNLGDSTRQPQPRQKALLETIIRDFYNPPLTECLVDFTLG